MSLLLPFAKSLLILAAIHQPVVLDLTPDLVSETRSGVRFTDGFLDH
jgi:hypothetical protein